MRGHGLNSIAQVSSLAFRTPRSSPGPPAVFVIPSSRETAVFEAFHAVTPCRERAFKQGAPITIDWSCGLQTETSTRRVSADMTSKLPHYGSRPPRCSTIPRYSSVFPRSLSRDRLSPSGVRNLLQRARDFPHCLREIAQCSRNNSATILGFERQAFKRAHRCRGIPHAKVFNPANAA